VFGDTEDELLPSCRSYSGNPKQEFHLVASVQRILRDVKGRFADYSQGSSAPLLDLFIDQSGKQLVELPTIEVSRLKMLSTYYVAWTSQNECADIDLNREACYVRRNWLPQMPDIR